MNIIKKYFLLFSISAIIATAVMFAEFVESAEADNQLLETIKVNSKGKAVTSQNVLASGVTYQIVASGSVQIGGPGWGDAEFGYSLDPDSGEILYGDNCGNTPSGVDFGIGIDDAVNDNLKYPAWGKFAEYNHVYTVSFQGNGSTISLNYHDCNYEDNFGSFAVEIYEPTTKNPSLTKVSFAPQIVLAGDTINGFYEVNNPNSFAVNVGLGMSIKATAGGQEIGDPATDAIISVSPGINMYSRIFHIPSSTPLGEYMVAIAIWDGIPSSSQQLSFPGWQSGLTLQAPPPIDTDGDGIFDDVDECRFDPEDYNGYLDEDGCSDVKPPIDTDGDGIFDDVDECRFDPEDYNGYLDEDGCPDIRIPLEYIIPGIVAAGAGGFGFKKYIDSKNGPVVTVEFDGGLE